MSILDWRPVDRQNEDFSEQSQSLAKSYIPIFTMRARAQRFINTTRGHWRKQVLFGKAPMVTGKPISGRILELNARLGWVSALASRRDGVEEVYTLDANPYCVEELIPKVQNILNADKSKITHVLGYPDALPDDEKFDYVMSVGTLSTTPTLNVVLSECYKVLKPGGWVFSSESCDYNHIKGEHNFNRLCTIEAAAHDIGFDVYAFTFQADGGKVGDEMFKKRLTYKGFKKVVAKPHFAHHSAFDKALIVLQKPD